MGDHKTAAKIGGVTAIAVLASVSYLVLNDKLVLPAGRVRGEHLKGLLDKLSFTLKYQVLGVLWLVFCQFYVGSKRAGSAAVDPTSGNEHLILVSKNIFNNSMEQYLQTLVAQLVSLTYLTGQQVVKVIPLVNFLFFFGRITFFLGYPHKRSFGFLLTSFPTIALIGFDLYKFTQFLNVL